MRRTVIQRARFWYKCNNNDHHHHHHQDEHVDWIHWLHFGWIFIPHSENRALKCGHYLFFLWRSICDSWRHSGRKVFDVESELKCWKYWMKRLNNTLFLHKRDCPSERGFSDVTSRTETNWTSLSKKQTLRIIKLYKKYKDVHRVNIVGNTIRCNIRLN